MPSGPVEVTLATPGTPAACVTCTVPVRALAVTGGACVAPAGRITS